MVSCGISHAYLWLNMRRKGTSELACIITRARAGSINCRGRTSCDVKIKSEQNENAQQEEEQAV